MMRLSSPKYDFAGAIDECSAGITGNASLLAKLIAAKSELVKLEGQYLLAAEDNKLYLLNPVGASGTLDPIVVQGFTKSELVKLYDTYFVPSEKPARAVYESLLNSAKEKCPFCGGVGTPRNLDHFLPKAHFPQFSILPKNLVPSCRDCNMDGKGHSYAVSEDGQIIQPYADAAKFFAEQWVYARYNTNNANDPGEFEYFVSAPLAWTAAEKSKVVNHFKQFEIAKKYATKAAELLGMVLSQIRLLKQTGLDNQSLREVLLQPGIDKAPFPNHWQRAMYQALAARYV
jgi:hypothetical protein